MGGGDRDNERERGETDKKTFTDGYATFASILAVEILKDQGVCMCGLRKCVLCVVIHSLQGYNIPNSASWLRLVRNQALRIFLLYVYHTHSLTSTILTHTRTHTHLHASTRAHTHASSIATTTHILKPHTHTYTHTLSLSPLLF